MPVKKGNVRVWTSIPDDVDKRVNEWSDRMGVRKSVLLGLAVQSGLDALVRAVSPAESVPPAMLASILIEAQKQGVEIDWSDIAREVLKDGGKVK